MLWVKAFHIIAVICWFAGLFYLPRLFVYHAQSTDTTSRERFVIMERKLYRGIMMPSMLATVILGLWLVSYDAQGYLQQGWLHAKLTLVAALLIYHFYCGHLLREFREGRNRHGHVFYRWMNELPVLALIGIVILVVVKPF